MCVVNLLQVTPKLPWTTSTVYTEIRPMYPAQSINIEEITYAPAIIVGSLIPHSSR